MHLSDGYECEIVEGTQSASGAFDGIPFEAEQSPILPEHVFDVDAGMTLAEMGRMEQVLHEMSCASGIPSDYLRFPHLDGPEDLGLEYQFSVPLSIFKYPKASRKIRKHHAERIAVFLGHHRLKEAKALCAKASKANTVTYYPLNPDCLV